MPELKVDPTFEMHYDVYDFTDPWRTDVENILLVHGNTRNSRFWYWYVPRLATNYRVATMDWRGHGRSPLPAGYQHNMTTLANDVRALLDHLGWNKVHYIAEATGGVIGCQFAADFPDRIQSLVLLGSAAPSGKEVPKQDLARWLKLIEEGGMIAWTRDHTARTLDRDKVDPGMFEWFATEMAKEPAEWDIAVKRWYPTYDIRPVLPRIAVPTQIQIAERTFMGLEQYQEMARLIPKSELLVYYGQPHYTFMSHREETLQAVLNFLRRVSAREGERS
jgi:pimeloyl-ACP methyl ester carboxylesterase